MIFRIQPDLPKNRRPVAVTIEKKEYKVKNNIVTLPDEHGTKHMQTMIAFGFEPFTGDDPIEVSDDKDKK